MISCVHKEQKNTTVHINARLRALGNNKQHLTRIATIFLGASILTQGGALNFSNITTSEKKNGFLLIETFSKRNYGHLDQLRVAFYYLSGFLVNTSNTPLLIIKTIREDF